MVMHGLRGSLQPPVSKQSATVTNVLPIPVIGVSVPYQSFGISQPQVWGDQVTSFEMAVRTQVNTVMFYMNLYESWPSGINRIIAAGKTPLITLMPFTTQSPLTADLAGIVAGNYDSQIAQWARFLNGKGIIRFAHEMNGTIQVWGDTYGASNYVTLWNHVRSVWRSAETIAGITHSPWMWSPNIGNAVHPFAPYYPGDGACEYVALDGYSYSAAGFPTFSSVFDTDVTALAALTSKPMIVGETGVSTDHPSRAAWITGMFTYLTAHPSIKGFCWFEHPTGSGATGNDMLAGDIASSAAFAKGVAVWAPSIL